MRYASILLLAIVLATTGCQKGSEGDASRPAVAGEASTKAATEMTPEELGKLGAEIKKQPDKAQQLLSERGLDAKSYEQAVRRVTEDPEASKKYAEAFRNAEG